MAISKDKSPYIERELLWLEEQAEKLMAYIDNNPVDDLKDRMGYRQMKGGGQMPFCIATIEQQHANIRNTLKDYGVIMASIKHLREKEDQKKPNSRGDQDLTPDELGLI